jgi:hypothetical protein
MIDDRRGAARLDAELARREDAETRMAAALLELEQHPGHVLLSGGAPTGGTGQRWAAAQAASAGLWRDFTAYRSAVRAARAVRERRARPGERELAELRRLLVEPSIEIGRTAVALPERGLTGAPERVEMISLGELGARMEEAFTQVSRLAAETDAAHTAFLAELVPVLERLADARRRAAELGPGHAEAPEAAALADLGDRADALHRRAATDPLARAAVAPELAALATGVRDLADRLDRTAAQRDRWEADLDALRRDLAGLGRLRTEAAATRDRARELVVGQLPALPDDDRAALRAALDRLERTPGWAARTAGLAALRVAVADATTALRTAHDLAAGLLERRDELRGRFSAFRARATRLGRAEDPEVLELDEQLRRLLWTAPCDLAATTRALAAYRRHLAPVAGSPA